MSAGAPQAGGRLRIAFGADDINDTVEAVAAHLDATCDLIRPTEETSWPELSVAVAEEVAAGRARFGVLLCWTGTGTAIAANKVVGIRAAQASDPWIAENARRWNDANVLTLSLKRLTPDEAVACVRAFLAVEAPDPDEVDTIARLRDPVEPDAS